MIERLKKWYVKYPSLAIVFYIAGHAYGPQYFAPEWLVRLAVAAHGG